MKKIILILILLWTIVCPTAEACDACGISSNNIGAGLLTNYRSNFLGFSWQQSVFTNANSEDNELKDDFQVVTLSARYHFTDRWKINLRLPYKHNVRTLNNSTTKIHGLSDISVLGNYTLINGKSLFKKSMLYLEIGGGLKIPNGKYNSTITDRELPENFNIGNGSLGFIGNTNLVITKNQGGVVWRNSYQHNLKSNSGYRFGSQVNSQLLFFIEKKIKKINVVPNMGISGEWTSADQFANGNSAHGTGGKGAYIAGGLQVKFKTWLIGSTYQLPFVQQYADGEVMSKGQLSCRLSFLF